MKTKTSLASDADAEKNEKIITVKTKWSLASDTEAEKNEKK